MAIIHSCVWIVLAVCAILPALIDGYSFAPFSPMHNKHRSLIEPKRALFFDAKDELPPPLPVKKKHSKFTARFAC